MVKILKWSLIVLLASLCMCKILDSGKDDNGNPQDTTNTNDTTSNNGNGSESWDTVPTPPLNLAAAKGLSNQFIRLTFTLPDTQDIYYLDIYRSSIQDTGAWSKHSTVFLDDTMPLPTSHLDSVGLYNTLFFYKIKAGNRFGQSDYSSIDSAWILSYDPDNPDTTDTTGQTAQPYDGSITTYYGQDTYGPTFEWSTVTGNTYIWYRAVNDTSQWTAVGEFSNGPFIDSTLQPNMTYYYAVTEKANGVESGKSDIIAMIAGPAAPNDIEASSLASSSVTFSWSTVVGATGYSVVTASANGSGSPFAEYISDTFYTMTGLGAHGDVSIAVQSRVEEDTTAVIVMAFSDTFTVTTLYAAPASLRASRDKFNQIDLSWVMPQHTEGVIQNPIFTLFRALDTAQGYAAVASGLTDTVYSDTTVLADTGYYYKVMAMGPDSILSDTSDYIYGSAVALVAPPNLDWERPNNQHDIIRVYWDSAAGAVDYNLYVKSTYNATGTWELYGSTSDTTYNITGLRSGLNYYVGVTSVSSDNSETAITQVGNNVYATSANHQYRARDLAFTATTPGQVTLDWGASLSGLDSLYNIFRKVSGSAYEYLTSVNTPTKTYTDTGLTAGITIHYWVESVVYIDEELFSANGIYLGISANSDSLVVP